MDQPNNDMSSYIAIQIFESCFDIPLNEGFSDRFMISDTQLKSFITEDVTAEKINDELVILAKRYPYEFSIDRVGEMHVIRWTNPKKDKRES